MSDLEENVRSRPINGEEESEEGSGSDSERDREAPKQKPSSNAPEAAESAPGQLKKATKKRKPAFSENNLVKAKGLLKIYEDFPQRCQYKGKGREPEFLRGLMIAYKEWGYQLFPGLAFEDLAERIEKLGGKARTRDLMHELRDKERDRVFEETYGRSAVDDAREREAIRQAAQEADSRDEREVERIVGSRYMDVDKEKDSTGDGRNEGKTSSAEAMNPAILSMKVRERMEENRRLALERLRVKREEASKATTAGAGLKPLETDMPVDVSERIDSMDLDAHDDMANSGFKDDEATLAEIEKGGNTKRATVNTGATISRAEATDPPPTASTFASMPLRSIANDASVIRMPETSTSLGTTGDTLEDLTTPSKTSGIGPIGRAACPSHEAAASEEDEAPNDTIDRTSTMHEAAASSESIEVRTMLENNCSKVTEMVASNNDGDSEWALSEMTTAAEYADTVGTAVGVAVTKGSSHVNEVSMESPSKRRTLTSGRVPLSPLGALLASTDVPAELKEKNSCTSPSK